MNMSQAFQGVRLLRKSLVLFLLFSQFSSSGAAAKTPSSPASVDVTEAEQWSFDFDERHAYSGVYTRGEDGALIVKPPQEGAAAPRLGLFDYLGRPAGALSAGARDGGAFTFHLPTERLGYFEVRPLDGNATKMIPALGSRPAGFVSFCVVEPPRADASSGFHDPFAGIQGTVRLPGTGPRGWPLYPALGISSAPVGYYSWSVTEPKEETADADFEMAMEKDEYPHLFESYKMVPIFTIDTMPKWAVTTTPESQKMRPGQSFGLPPNDMGAFKAYLLKLVPRLTQKYRFLPHRIYQITWEPNDGWGWYADDKSLIELTRTARETILQLDPTAKIAGPTIAGMRHDEMANFDRVMLGGLGREINVMSAHFYPTYTPGYPELRKGLPHMLETVERSAGRALPFIDTESGHDAAAMGDQEASARDHARGYATQALIKKAYGASIHTYFYLADGGPGLYGLMFNLTAKMQVGPSKVSPKPDFPMVRQVNDMTADTDAIGAYPFVGAQDGVLAYAFKKRDTGDTILAIWDPSGRDREVQIDTAREEVEVFDEFGNKKRKETRDRRLSLKLSASPSYVGGVAEKVLAHPPMPPRLD
jgi:hypothetical protein